MEEKSRRELRKKICVHLTLVLCGILFIVFAVPKLAGFFAPLIVAWIIAIMANPLVHFLEKRIKIVRKHGSAIVIVLVILIIIGLLYALLNTLFVQMSSLVEKLPDIYETVMGNIQAFMESMHEKYNIIPANIKNIFSNDDSKLNDYILAALDSLQVDTVSAVGSVASSLVDMFIISILTIMIAYFFTAGNDKIKNFVKSCMPEGINSFIMIVKNTVFVALGGYIKACFQIMIVMFVPIALITAILDFLPFIGTGTVLMPWAAYSIITGEYPKAIALVAAYLVTMIVRRLLEPKLVGDSIGMSPFLTLISMFIGFRLMGVSGLILGIPAGMILKEFYEQGLMDNTINGIKILASDINEYRKYW